MISANGGARMRFVFYDTESIGGSTDFDQILQFAAIRTNADRIETDRFEIRCHLRPHILPHPVALKVTGMRWENVTDPTRPSHYEMVRAIRNKLEGWSPAIFVDYNSMRFDEALLRQPLPARFAAENTVCCWTFRVSPSLLGSA